MEPRLLLNGDFRSIDGTGNNLDHPQWGAVNAQLMRTTSIEYEDGISEPAGGMDMSGRPNPRVISNRVVSQSESIVNDRSLSGFVFQWGQFLDHDMDLTEEAHPLDPFFVPVPAGDPHLDPNMPIPLLRSRFDTSTGDSVDNPRQQINQITSYIDASNVYGSDPVRADALRGHIGGALLSSAGSMLPYNLSGQPNAAPGPDPTAFYLAGDVRANEQPGLMSLHTLFVREHNWWADQIAARDYAGQDLSDPEIDEAIYQQARAIVGAELQVITYQEFLPALMGPAQLDSYSGYDPEVNASIANLFSAALYRVGHTMLPPELMRLEENGQVIADGNIALGDAFFQPGLMSDYGIEPYLRGLGELRIQEIDAHIVDGVRNMLFDPPAQFDLAAINMQRGRDHGLPDYNQARIDLGLRPVRRFRDITTDLQTRRAINDAYDGNLNNIDVWLGGIAERHLPGGSVGELIHHVLADQFTRLRDGDRYYYENVFDGQQLIDLQNTRLSDIIQRNTSIVDIQDEVFRNRDVLIYRADASDAGVDVMVRVTPSKQIQVIDNSSGAVLASADAAATTAVVLFGSRGDDHLVIDGSVARMRRIPVEVHGGAGVDVLHVSGSERSERIIVKRSSVQINTGHVYLGNIEKVWVDGGAGNDLVRQVEDFDGQVILDGGAGNDRLAGGDGDAIMIGGAGNDSLMGGRGDDILIGGEGRDRMTGRRGQDVLIDGTTQFDHDHLALSALLAEWTSARSYTQRVANMLGPADPARLNGDYFLSMGSTVVDDGDVDYLIGGKGMDLFFMGPRDRMVSHHPAEQVAVGH